MPKQPKPERTPFQKTLDSVKRRAKRILALDGKTDLMAEIRPVKRSQIRQAEHVAHAVLDQSKYGICADLARSMIDIAVALDKEWIKLFPIFEEIDDSIKKENCYLEVLPTGWYFRDAKGCLISEGATLRQWLASHAQMYGAPADEPYDREME